MESQPLEKIIPAGVDDAHVVQHRGRVGGITLLPSRYKATLVLPMASGTQTAHTHSRPSVVDPKSQTCQSSTHPGCSEKLSSSQVQVAGSARYAPFIACVCCTYNDALPRPLPFSLQRLVDAPFTLTAMLITADQQGGANIILLARRLDALNHVAEACVTAHQESGLNQGGRFASIQLDVSDKAQVAGLWYKVPKDLRNVDILGAYPHTVAESRLMAV